MLYRGKRNARQNTTTNLKKSIIMNKNQSPLHALFGVLFISGIFCMCFTYTGHKIVKELLTLIIK